MVERGIFNRTKKRFPPPDPHGADGLSLYELSQFRTEICSYKASNGNGCMLRENCVDSHCLSWHRRNPFLYAYRPMLCPNTKFWTTDEKRMKVKTWCKRGRSCMFSHTKEEQMYHPLIYKTQICRDYPNNCFKPYCPFAHGLQQLKNPDSSGVQLIQGPELVEGSNGQPSTAANPTPDDRVFADFAKTAKEHEAVMRFVENLKATLARSSAAAGGNQDLRNDNASTEDQFDASILTLKDDALAIANLDEWFLTSVGLVAFKLSNVC